MKKILSLALIAFLSGCALNWGSDSSLITVSLSNVSARALSIQSLNPGDSVVMRVSDVEGNILASRTIDYGASEYSLTFEGEIGKLYLATALGRDAEFFSRGYGQTGFIPGAGDVVVHLTMGDFLDDLYSSDITGFTWDPQERIFEGNTYYYQPYFYSFNYWGEIPYLEVRVNGSPWTQYPDTGEGYYFSPVLELGLNKVEVRYLQSNGQYIVYTLMITYQEG